jgi:hypothetical protein
MSVFDYEPETIEEYIKKINPKVKESVITRAQAAIGLFTSNLFWQDPITFGVICRTLNRKNKPEAGVPTINDIAWGMAEVDLLMGNNNEDDDIPDTYSISIDKYVRYLLRESGIYDTPESMTGISSPDIHTKFDDPEQLRSIQERSDQSRAVVDLNVNEKMTELLKQVASLDIAFSTKAKEELNTLMKQQQ